MGTESGGGSADSGDPAGGAGRAAAGEAGITRDLAAGRDAVAAVPAAAGVRWVAIPVALPDPGRTAAFEIEGRALLLCNVDGEPHVVRDECSHARTPLSGGRLCGFLLECPLHGGKIDVRDGSPAAPPIRRPVATHAARRTPAGIEVALP